MNKKFLSFSLSLLFGFSISLVTPVASMAAGTPVIAPEEVATATANVSFTINYELDDQSGTLATCVAPTGSVVTFGTVGDATNVAVTIAYGTTDTAVITGKIPASSSEVSDVDVVFSFTHTCNSTPVTEGDTITDGFDYLAAPTITKVFPEGGQTGDTITITGSGFAAGTKVKIGASGLLTPTIASLTSMTVTAPVGTGLVAVEVVKQGTVKVEKLDAFTYTSVVPDVVKTGSNPATITIKDINLGFANCTGSVTNPAVTVDGVGATGEAAQNFNASRGVVDIVATPPTLPVDTETQDRDVVVSFDLNCGGAQTTTRTLVDALDYYNEPSITSFTPNSGGVGTVVTITGDDLLGTTSVKFGSVAATSFNVISDTSITATAPAGIGSVTISVTTNGLTKVSSTAFTYTQLTITSVSPATGPIAGGQVVTIEGTGLKGITSVLFGSTPATGITYVTVGSKITVLSPAVGSVPLNPVDVSVVTASDTFTSLGAYRYVAAPTVTSFDISGPIQGGTTLNIVGSNFFGDSDELVVKFGNATATTVSAATDGKSMSVLLPAKSVSDTTNKVKLSVKNSSGSPVIAGDFDYLAPAINTISPSTGPLSGGNVVTITGVSFTGATEVSFGTATTGVISKTNFLSATDTSIRVLVPAASASGKVTVTVKISSSLSASKVEGYDYSSGPTGLAISPKIGVLAGGTKVTITGSNLSGLTKVQFGTKDGTNLVVNPEGTSLTVNTPSGSGLGLVDVLLIGPTGTTILTAAYEYVAKVCTVSSNLGQIRFEKGSEKLTAKAKVTLSTLAGQINASGCEVVTLTAYTFKATNPLQKQMSKLTNSRILKVKNFLNKALATVNLLVTYERVALATQKTSFTSLDQFKVNRLLRFGTK